jgi:serine/threonine protein phosphatase PrpC
MPHIDLTELEELDARLSVEDDLLTWNASAHSDIGQVREANEDAYLCSPEEHLWAVADGMGGLSRGDYASKVVVESLLYFSSQRSLPKSIIKLDSCLKHAHDLCRNTFPTKRVGSTVAALHARGNYCFFVWAGDSRIYRLRKGALEQMTADHTVAQEKCARGELSPTMAAFHPSAHVLTRAVGVNQDLWVDIDYTQAEPGDRYLLCTDGLYNDLETKEIQRMLAAGSPQQAVELLISSSVSNGGKDNTTAIVLDAMPPKTLAT